MRVLALNPGSSSLKAAVRSAAFAEPEFATVVERVEDVAGAVDAVAEQVSALEPDAVAHRVVHGGPDHYRPTVIDDSLVSSLRSVVPLAPLHLPGALETIAHARRRWPSVPHVACFDTGFHHDLPEVSTRLPVPDELVRIGIRRYGFHGLSVQSVLLTRPGLGDIVVAHLGSGCSVTAVGSDGRPRHTTMSLTPTAGMMSATRTGDLDPEIALYLVEQHGYSPAELRSLFDRGSGLAGVAGGRHDVRDLLAADDAQAALALEMFVRSAAMAIAACVTTLDGWDALAFTGGVGEHASTLRDRICARLRPPASVDVLVVPAEEELVLDRLTRDLLT